MDGVIVGHGEVFGRVRGIECPEINDLTAMGIGYTDGLVFSKEESGTAASGESLCRHISYSCKVKDGNTKTKMEGEIVNLIYKSSAWYC